MAYGLEKFIGSMKRVLVGYHVESHAYLPDGRSSVWRTDFRPLRIHTMGIGIQAGQWRSKNMEHVDLRPANRSVDVHHHLRHACNATSKNTIVHYRWTIFEMPWSLSPTGQKGHTMESLMRHVAEGRLRQVDQWRIEVPMICDLGFPNSSSHSSKADSNGTLTMVVAPTMHHASQLASQLVTIHDKNQTSAASVHENDDCQE
jgi:hypothetical protein